MHPNELATGLTGAWRLFLRDSQGLTFIDCSVAGAARSFRLAILLAPVYVMVLAIIWGPLLSQLDLGTLVIVEGLSWVIGWTAMPVIVYFLSEPMGVRDNWPAFVSTYNWAAPIQIAIVLPLLLLDAAGMTPGMAGFALALIVTLIRLSYLMFVIRVALGVGTGAAVGLTALDFFLGLFLELQSDSIIRTASDIAL
jgi:hypothetical protein